MYHIFDRMYCEIVHDQLFEYLVLVDHERWLSFSLVLECGDCRNTGFVPQ